jgi:hypothetical protein
MRNELEKFHHTVGILVKAYLNDTLEHGVCTKCAVGNLVIAAIPEARINLLVGWPEVFVTDLGGRQSISPENYAGEAKEQIDSTGYTWQELALIEAAFESADTDSFNEEKVDIARFNGLMAVVDVLADIHKVDLSVKEEAKALFAIKQF